MRWNRTETELEWIIRLKFNEDFVSYLAVHECSKTMHEMLDESKRWIFIYNGRAFRTNKRMKVYNILRTHQMFIINHELVSEQYGSAVAIDIV